MGYHKDLIEINKEIMLGKSCIKGTRITTEVIIEKVLDGYTINELIMCYPRLTRDKVVACFFYDRLN